MKPSISVQVTTALLCLAITAPASTQGFGNKAASAASIYGPVNDSLHPEHNCPGGFRVNECWWAWHCCEDSHGHVVHPFIGLCVAEPERLCTECVDQCVAACKAACGGSQACEATCKPEQCRGCRRQPQCGNAADFLVSGQCGIDWRPHAPSGIRPGAVEEFEALD